MTFVVLDLETTGLSPDRDRITEFGAVKVRGGDRLGEFQCLVRPDVPIPAGIARLTGITDELVAQRPPVEAALPAFLEFIHGTVLVAHNAHFDLGFLRAACGRLDYPRLDHVIVDTARLARRALLRGEVPNLRLATLASHFRARVRPEHRALPDARATVDVLHGLLERVGSLGVVTLEELRDYVRSTADPLYRKVSLVADAPHAPGVYRFLDARGEVLYVGKATDLRERLRRYFGQDRRRRIADLVRETTAVRWEVAPTELEAAVREVRAIHRHRPRYNRRSRHPERAVHLKLTRERYPRLSIVTAVRDPEALHVGPLPSRRVAERFAEAVAEVIPLRQCTDRLTASRGRRPCVLKDLGRCGAPCDGTQSEDGYAGVVDRYRKAVSHDPTALLDELRERMWLAANTGRFEQAARLRDRLHHVASVLVDGRDLAALVAAEELVAVRRDGPDREVAVVRRGRLAATARIGPEADLRDTVERLLATAEPAPPQGPPPSEDIEEIRLVLAWLGRRGARPLRVSGAYAHPLAGGAALAAAATEARRVGRALRRDRDELEGRKVLRRASA